MQRKRPYVQDNHVRLYELSAEPISSLAYQLSHRTPTLS